MGTTAVDALLTTGTEVSSVQTGFVPSGWRNDSISLLNSTVSSTNRSMDTGHYEDDSYDDYHTNASTWTNFSTVHSTLMPPKPHQPPPYLVLKIILCTVFLLATFFGNALVMYAYFTTKKLRTYTNHYIVGLAFADLVSGGIIPGLENVIWFLDTWPFSEGLCSAMQYLIHVFLQATFMMTLVICFDRFRALNMPLKHLKKKTLKHACFMISLAYIIPLIIWTPLILIFPYSGLTTRIQPPLCHGSYGLHPPLLILAMLCLSWAPMGATIILYVFVYSAVIRKGINKKRHIGEEASSDFKSEQQVSQRACKPADREPRERSYRLADGPAPKADSTDPTDAELPPKDKVYSISGGVSMGLTNLAYEQNEDEADDDNGNTRTNLEAPKEKVTTASVNPHKRPGFSARSRRSKRENRLASLRATRTLTYILVTTVVTAAPWSVFAFWGAVSPYNFPITDNQFKFLGWLAHLSSTVNPFCYAVCNPPFKEAFLRILRCWKRSVPRSSTMKSQGSQNGR
ncbi:muscarinic acetylcholine receptor M5-like [Patiria miniata]|uniref:G-protein coupled receptors family 1 profile domain-containing protein n=1 Tax=Patiria miniata TaxID=46514 RepID=A0A914AHR0_PATMI|nr:muscarinic acetylcholine receptor M5-like [Patiria miniata]